MSGNPTRAEALALEVVSAWLREPDVAWEAPHLVACVTAALLAFADERGRACDICHGRGVWTSKEGAEIPCDCATAQLTAARSWKQIDGLTIDELHARLAEFIPVEEAILDRLEALGDKTYEVTDEMVERTRKKMNQTMEIIKLRAQLAAAQAEVERLRGNVLKWTEEAADLFRRLAAAQEALREIVALSAGWDDDGSMGPRHPLSWESVGRMAMDYARAALAAPDAPKET